METKKDKNVLSKRLKKMESFGFLNKEKVSGKNQKNYTIKKEFVSKIKNIINLFSNL